MKNKGKEYCDSKFTIIKDSVTKIITQKLSSDFAETLQLIKFLGNKITKTEVDAFIGKYKNNYLEIRSLIIALKENENVRNLDVISSDDILENTNEIQRKVNHFFDYPNSYEYIAMLIDDGTLEEYDKCIYPFMSKEFIYDINERVFENDVYNG